MAKFRPRDWDIGRSMMKKDYEDRDKRWYENFTPFQYEEELIHDLTFFLSTVETIDDLNVIYRFPLVNSDRMRKATFRLEKKQMDLVIDLVKKRNSHG